MGGGFAIFLVGYVLFDMKEGNAEIDDSNNEEDEDDNDNEDDNDDMDKNDNDDNEMMTMG